MGQAPLPLTYCVDVDEALATLDHAQMQALASMFERWALTEPNIDGEQRTRLIQYSVDYEAIALFAGPDWRAPEPLNRSSIIAFVATLELQAQRRAALRRPSLWESSV